MDYIEEFDKKYYKIKDVAEILGIPTSTLRYWESEFPDIRPRRSKSNQRYYTPEAITTLRMINYLVKDKGLRIDAAKEEMKINRKNVSRRLEVIDLLTETRAELKEIQKALLRRK